MATPDERQEPVTDEFEDEIHEVPSHTPDFRTELAEDLARLVPEAVADGRIDVEKLRELLDEDAVFYCWSPWGRSAINGEAVLEKCHSKSLPSTDMRFPKHLDND